MRKFYIQAIAIGMIALPFWAKSQITNLTNTATINTEFVGWNAGTAKPLDIRNDFNQPINIFTYNAQRMKLNHNVSYNVNSFSGVRDGYLLLGQNNGFSGSGTSIYNNGAFSLLHLNGYNSSSVDDLGYRSWMQTGITLTGNPLFEMLA